ncbi:MAG: HAMP domain-containing sensor histidine kinase [Chloroflexota bacterium]
MTNMTLRTRIFLSYLALVTVAITFLSIFANRQLIWLSEVEYIDTYDRNATILHQRAEMLTIAVRENQVEQEVAYGELGQLAQEFDMRLQILERDGMTLLYDTNRNEIPFFSPEPPIDVQTMLLIDEPADAIDESSGWLYRSHYIFYDGQPDAILRVGQSSDILVQRRLTRQIVLLIGSIGIGLLITLGLGSFMANSLTRPLDQLGHTAQTMAMGNLKTRAETAGPPEVKKLARDFNNMAEAVEGMIAEQKAFAGNAAHELRTPLTAIRLRTELLLAGQLGPDLAQRYIEEIDTEARRLSGLVEDLKFLSQSDANYLEVGKDTLDFGRLIRRLQQEFSPQLEKKNLAWQTAIDPDLPVVEAGLNHIQIVMRNLIDNAIKYTPAGGLITISATANPNHLVVTVEDTGIGITADELPKLFNRFYRADPSRNRAVSGTGLGLGIVKSILTLYNGSIAITSPGRDHGTQAKITLPLPTNGNH